MAGAAPDSPAFGLCVTLWASWNLALGVLEVGFGHWCGVTFLNLVKLPPHSQPELDKVMAASSRCWAIVFVAWGVSPSLRGAHSGRFPSLPCKPGSASRSQTT
eukprot:2806746-Prorocentrum_lima.AAC.1